MTGEDDIDLELVYIQFYSVKSESCYRAELATSFMDDKVTDWVRGLREIPLGNKGRGETFKIDRSRDDENVRQLRRLKARMLEEIEGLLMYSLIIFFISKKVVCKVAVKQSKTSVVWQ